MTPRCLVGVLAQNAANFKFVFRMAACCFETASPAHLHRSAVLQVVDARKLVDMHGYDLAQIKLPSTTRLAPT